MSVINADFSKQIEAWAAATNRSIAEAHRTISIKLFTRIIMDTPVDTGHAAGGWIPSMGAPVDGLAGERNLSVAIKALPSQIAYLSNSVHYIDLLEYGTAPYGFSPKAPRGMVRKNIADFRALVAEAIEEVRQRKSK